MVKYSGLARSLFVAMKPLEIIFGIVRIPLDFLAIMGALFLAYFLRPYTDLIPWVQYHFEPEKLPSIPYFSTFAFYAALTLILIFAVNGHYSLKTTANAGRESWRIINSTLIWLMAIIAFYFLVIHDLFFSRVILAHSFVFIIAFVLIERFILKQIQYIFLRLGYGKRNLLFVGVNKETELIYQELKNKLQYTIAGAIGKQRYSTKKSQLNIIGVFEKLEALVLKHQIDEIICTIGALSEEQVSQVVDFCQEEHLGYSFIPAIQNFNYARIDFDLLADRPIITPRSTILDGWGRVWKRIFDLLGASMGILILSPFFALIAILIKLDSPGSIFYKSERVGLAGKRVFKMYKFRSMRSDADRLKKQLLSQNQRSGPLFKIKNDPRVTRLGYFLRKTTIDELPQLFNVLKGDISLVGPRPHLPEEVAKYQKHHKIVLAIKPGMTGLAQINGRSDLDFEEEVRFDTYYIKNWSLWLDMKILFKTAFVVGRGKGAD